MYSLLTIINFLKLKPKTVMKSIYKYPIQTDDYQEIEMPKNSEILCVQAQNGIACLWASVYVGEERKEKKKIVIHGTGHNFDPLGNRKYIGTYQLFNGSFVGHVFEILD